MNKRKAFAKSFRRLMLQVRQETLYTQKGLSATTGLSRQFISQLETGLRGPSVETFCKLAWGVGLTPAKMLEKFMRIYEQETGLERHSSGSSEAVQYINKAKKYHEET